MPGGKGDEPTSSVLLDLLLVSLYLFIYFVMGLTYSSNVAWEDDGVMLVVYYVLH